MITTVLLGIVTSLGGGKLLQFLLRNHSEHEISPREYFLTAVAAVFIVIPTTVFVGFKGAQSNRTEFTEYLNGWETRAVFSDMRCTKNGSCRWSYPCDPHLVTYTCNCDDKGVCQTCTRVEWDDCPYCTYERQYTVGTTIGDVVIARNVLPENPNQHRWRDGTAVPLDVQQRAGVGPPPFWLQAKNRLDNNSPGPVTLNHDYTNYILPSEQSVFAKFSPDVDFFKAKGLLPQPASGVIFPYFANKVSAVGITIDGNRWQTAIAYVNASLGHDRQGDLRLVLVKSDAVNSNPDRYVNALKAYSADWRVHGKASLPKNAIMLVVGSADGNSVSWARAFTGMPTGNEYFLTTVNQNLSGKPLTPESVLGIVKADRSLRASVDSGAANLLLVENETSFKRQPMGFYAYLKNEIPLLPRQRLAVGALTVFLGLAVWFVPFLIYDPSINPSFRRYI